MPSTHFASKYRKRFYLCLGKKKKKNGRPVREENAYLDSLANPVHRIIITWTKILFPDIKVNRHTQILLFFPMIYFFILLTAVPIE